MATELAKAYVQIIPSAKGIKGMLHKELGGEASAAGESAGKSFGGSLLSGLAGIGKAAAAALGAATAAVGAFSTMSLGAYGNYEQLVGGVETLFGAGGKSLEEYAQDVGQTIEEAKDAFNALMSAQSSVMDNAANAYKNAGMSANEYMETVTSFSASLIQSLGGDTEAAAQYADMAITDMSDNANKMGTAIDSIQNAYQGFAKQNYTMLDNLKLGYGGTKSEMERLILDAEKLDSTFKAQRDNSGDLAMSYADIVDAIHIVQSEMGITGTTADEAAKTIQGSVSAAKSAWQNLATGIADGNADLDTLIGNFVDSVGTAAGNIVPRFTQILSGMGEVIQEIAPILSEQIPALISEVLPSMISAGANLLVAIITGIITALPELAAAVPQIVEQIGTSLEENWPAIQTAGSELINILVTGITTNLPALIPAAVEAILQLVETITNPDSLGSFVDAALQLIISLADGLIAALPTLLEKAPIIIDNLVTAIANNLPKILQAGIGLLVKFALGIVNAIPQLVAKIPQIITSFINGIKRFDTNIFNIGKDILKKVGDGLKSMISDAWTWGSDMIQGFVDGIMGKAHALLDSVKNIANNIRSFLHFSRPDEGPLRDYETWMPDFMQGLAKGIDSNAWRVQNAVKSLTQRMEMELSPSVQMPSLHAEAIADTSTSMGGGTVTNLYQTIYTHDSLSESELTREAEDLLERGRWKNP